VAVTDKGGVVMKILSRADKQSGRIAGKRPMTPGDAPRVTADDAQEQVLTGHLDKYYDRVVSTLCDADEIMIFGPGAAKGELLRRIESDDLIGRIARIETADKMTIPQIAAKVRKYFQDSKPASVRGGRSA
jgi:hypothetical protein